MRITIAYRDPVSKKPTSRVYDTDKSKFICNTPFGVLYQKRGQSIQFWLYHSRAKTKKEMVEEVTWHDASNLVREFGTRDQYHELFLARKQSKSPEDGFSHVRLPYFYRMKAQRNASRRKMNVTQYVKFLIDKDDSQNNY